MNERNPFEAASDFFGFSGTLLPTFEWYFSVAILAGGFWVVLSRLRGRRIWPFWIPRSGGGDPFDLTDPPR